MNDITLLIAYSFIGSIAGLIGGVVLLFKRNWAERLASVSVPLAAGVLLSLSLLDLFPEAVEEIGGNAFNIVLIVFVILFLFERFLFYLHHHNGEVDGHHEHVSGHGATVVPLVVVGDTIHNFLDGLVIGASFLVDPALAMLVAFSTFLHETPHEIADFGILVSKGYSSKKAFLLNFFSAMATFPGAFFAYFYAERIEGGVGILLALAAGFFLYVAATDFLPESAHSPRKLVGVQAFYLIVGILAIVLIGLIFPEVGH